jgi:hypothetical protein
MGTAEDTARFYVNNTGETDEPWQHGGCSTSRQNNQDESTRETSLQTPHTRRTWEI